MMKSCLLALGVCASVAALGGIELPPLVSDRMVLQAGWAVIAFLVPSFHFIAGAAPVLFPKFTILYLQLTGKLYPASEKSAEAEAPQE